MVRAALLPTTAVQTIGAKGRRELSPSRRRTAREQDLPWAVFSFPIPYCRVNHPALAVGTPAAAVVCSKGVNAGSCPAGPRHDTVARPAKTPLDAGDAGWPVNSIGPPPTDNNADATRPDVIAIAAASDRLFPNRTTQPFTSSRRHQRSKPSRLPPPTYPASSPLPAWASAQPKFPKNLPACLATGQAAMSSSSPPCLLSIRNSARACVARRYDACGSAKPDFGTAAAGVSGLFPTLIADRPKLLPSCRHIVEDALP
jgi:hypothetical protein